MKTQSMFYDIRKDGWEEWQHDYKWGAFYLFPPSPVMEEVNTLRSVHDPVSAEICKAHISLSDTLPRAITEEDIEELQSALSSVNPFMMEYGPLRTYPPYPGVSFDIRPDNLFYDLRRTIHGTSLFSDSNLSRQGIPPHMTIAEFGMDMAQSESLKMKLQPQVSSGKWLCDKISFAVPNENFYFEEVLSIPLGAKRK